MFAKLMNNRSSSYWINFAAAGLLAVAVSGCGGGGGDTTAAPPGGGAAAAPATAPNAAPPPGGTLADASTLTSAQWTNLSLQGQVTSVTIHSPPVVNFWVTDANGNPLKGLAQKNAKGAYPNFAFALAKLIPANPSTNSPSRWVSYMVVTTPAAGATATPGFPEPENIGTLVDNGDGSYTYTFALDVTQAKSYADGATYDANHVKTDLDDLTYDPTLPHRVLISVGGNQPGTATPAKSSANITYDFIPATGKVTTASDPQRDIVSINKCNECHDKLSVHEKFFPPIHDTRLCVVCHTEQQKYASANADPATGSTLVPAGTYAAYGATLRTMNRALPNFPNMVHHIHMGDKLFYQGYNQFGVKYNEVRFPQDQRNCTKCHDGSATSTAKTANGDNWKNVPSRLACGGCHDGINFATGKGTTVAGATTGHIGGAKQDDSQCVLCHDSTTIPAYHQTTIASMNNPVVQSGVASFQFKITSATINSSNQVVVGFQILKDGTAVKLNPYSAGAVPITGFTYSPIFGGFFQPSFFIAYATAQDGIATPSDWNSGHATLTLQDAWAQANGNIMTGPDASNTYTVTMVASSTNFVGPSHSIAVPADAKMVTVFMAGSLNQAGVAEHGGDLPGLPSMMAATGNTPDGKPNVARRVVFTENKCNTCHDRLGTSPYFHNGNYSIAMCPACHTANQGGYNGWSASSRVWVHGIHGASKRTNPFTWHAASTTDGYWTLGYPGILKDCETCHLPGTNNFDPAKGYTDALIGNMLYVVTATGKLNPASATNYGFPQAAPVGSGNYAYGLAVDNTTDYGTGWSIDTAAGPNQGKLVAKTTQDNNLVTSPIAAACTACHDNNLAIEHVRSNGGSFYAPRKTALATTETCLLCHGVGKIADIKAMHAK